MAKRIYAEVGNLQSVIDWLKTKPEDKCTVMIGGSDDAGPIFLNNIGSDIDLASWIFNKANAGEFDFKSIRDTAELPIGVVLDD